MPRARPDLLEVELVEDDAGPDATSERDPGPPPWRRAVGRVPRRVWAAVLTAALAVGGGVTVSGYLQDAAEDARLAQVAGLSTSLDGPLTELWRAPGSGVMATTGDLLLLWKPTSEGITAVDRVTGDVRYSLPGYCQVVVADPKPGLGAAFAPLAAGPDDLLLCVERRFAQLTDTDPGVSDESGHLHSVVSGELLRSIPLGTPDDWSVVGGDVITLDLDRDRHVDAARWDLGTGERRWAFRSAEPAPTQGDGWTSATSDTAVGYRMGDWSMMLDPDTGVPLAADALPAAGILGTWGPVDAGDGATLSGTFSAGGRSETTVDPAGAEPFTVPGHVLPAAVDDGTAEGTLFVARSTHDPAEAVLHSVDATTGETRWTAPVAAGDVVALSGLVVVQDWLAITALDADTGRTRWATSSDSAPDGAGPGWGLVTDGRRLLTLEPQDREWTLVARDVRTGETAWTAPAPVAGGSVVQGPDTMVLVTGPAEVVALGQAGP